MTLVSVFIIVFLVLIPFAILLIIVFEDTPVSSQHLLDFH